MNEMSDKIEKLIATDRHGIYKKPNGDLVLLPVRRHHDWLLKGMTFLCEGRNVDEAKLKNLSSEKEDFRRKKAEELIEKHVEGMPKNSRNISRD